MHRYVLLFILFLLSLPISTQAQQYLWPTDSGRFLSSTFGETRAAHFHAGLDIKTWGREGYRVFAAKDGVIHRLLITERGYGKAIYIKHADSSFTVYAHLQRFNPYLQALADSIRLLDYSFEMEMSFDSLNLKVNQGDIIGYTGSSGIGPPHLHFEIRDSLDNPVNALMSDFSLMDDRSPVFSSLIIEPIEINSKVEGNPYPTTIRAKKDDDNVYDFGEVRISGKTGLAVDVYDLANSVPNKYAVYSLSLMQDTDTLFHQKLESFTYDSSSEMFMDRIAPFGSTTRGHHRLHAKEGVNNPFYLHSSDASILEPTDSLTTYHIVASDYFGNTSKAKITLRKELPAISQEPGIANPLKDWYWSENWASPDLVNTIDLTHHTLGFPWKKNQQLIFINHEIPANFSRIIPGKKHRIRTPDYNLLIHFNKDVFFDTLTVAATYRIENDEPVISIQPQMLPAKKDFKLEFYLGENFDKNNNYRLFRINNGNRLSYIKSQLIGKTIHGYPSGLGDFVIKADNDPPLVYNFRLRQTEYGQWLGVVSVEDNLSGINSKKSEFWINDVRGIAEYDYEENEIIYYLPGFTPLPSNKVHIKIEDKAGNKGGAFFEN
ncbi:MAG: M23 family metallopeptidase [Balneolaceae bacterium]